MHCYPSVKMKYWHNYMRVILGLIGQNWEPMTLYIGLEVRKTSRTLLKHVIYAKKTQKEIVKIKCCQAKFPCHCGQPLKWILFTMDGHTFLLVVDVTSRFPVVWILNTESCISVLNALKRVLWFWASKDNTKW